jgi:hypothetical protein
MISRFVPLAFGALVIAALSASPAEADGPAAPRITSPVSGAKIQLPSSPDAPPFAFKFTPVEGADLFECVFKHGAGAYKLKLPAGSSECPLAWVGRGTVHGRGKTSLTVRAHVGGKWVESAKVEVEFSQQPRAADPPR